MISKLPLWNMNNLKPAFNDLESASAVDMVYKLYGKIQELINDYNTFAKSVNQSIDDFMATSEQNYECFKMKMIKTCNDYIEMMNMKLDAQDLEIANSITYIKDNLSEYVQTTINAMKESGELSEAILTAFDELGARVETLENSYANLLIRIDALEIDRDDLKVRVSTLENEKVKMIYTQETESLSFENMEVQEI